MQRIASILRLEGPRFDDTTIKRLDLVNVANRNAGLLIEESNDLRLLLFARAKTAAICAIELRRLDEATSEELSLTPNLRAAISIGPVLIGEKQVTGDAVEIAQNLASTLRPGDIFVSRSCREALGDQLPVDFEPLREEISFGYRLVVDSNEILSAIRHENPMAPDWSWRVTLPLIGMMIFITLSWIWFNMPD